MNMSIGTAVPSASQLAAVKHYFIQTVPVTQAYTAGDYELDAVALAERLFEEGHETLVMTGGSMFYIDAVCNGLDNLPDGDPGLRAELWKRLGGLHRFGEAVLLFQDGWQAEPVLSDRESRVDASARGIIFKNRPQGAEYDG